MAQTCGDFGGVKVDGSPCRIVVKEGMCGLHQKEVDLRETLLTDEQIREVKRLAEVDCTHEEIAHILEIPVRTFQRRLEDQDGVAAAYQTGKSAAHREVKQRLRHLIRDGDKTAIIFYLKTQCGWSETQRLEHSGEGGGPLLMAWTDAVKALDGDDDA